MSLPFSFIARPALRLAALALLVACADASSPAGDASADTQQDSGGASSSSAPASAAEFWSSLCDAADGCGWLQGEGNAELGSSREECLADSADSTLPSAGLAYLAKMERCVLDAHQRHDCDALVECYRRGDLSSRVCKQAARCNATVDEADCVSAMSVTPASRQILKFDHACTMYCIEAGPKTPTCDEVNVCLSVCR